MHVNPELFFDEIFSVLSVLCICTVLCEIVNKYAFLLLYVFLWVCETNILEHMFYMVLLKMLYMCFLWNKKYCVLFASKNKKQQKTTAFIMKQIIFGNWKIALKKVLG